MKKLLHAKNVKNDKAKEMMNVSSHDTKVLSIVQTTSALYISIYAKLIFHIERSWIFSAVAHNSIARRCLLKLVQWQERSGAIYKCPAPTCNAILQYKKSLSDHLQTEHPDLV